MNILSCCLFAALNATVSNLPPGDFADTEAATNIPVVVAFSEMNKLSFSLSLDASPSNSVEVAIGTDVDNDGNLASEEADYAFGCDCGTWFCRDAVQNRFDVLGTTDVSAGRVERTLILKKRNLDTCWNLVKVTRRGKAPICECVSAKGLLPGFKITIR